MNRQQREAFEHPMANARAGGGGRLAYRYLSPGTVAGLSVNK